MPARPGRSNATVYFVAVSLRDSDVRIKVVAASRAGAVTHSMRQLKGKERNDIRQIKVYEERLWRELFGDPEEWGDSVGADEAVDQHDQPPGGDR